MNHFNYVGAEDIAQKVTNIVLYFSVVFFGLVLLSMIFNKNRRRPRPKLDRAFIAEKLALFLIVAWSALVINGWATPNPWVRVVIWSFLGISEACVLWFIYLERYGRGAFTRGLRATPRYVHTHIQRLWNWLGISRIRSRQKPPGA